MEVSDDGLGFRRVGRIGAGVQQGTLRLDTSARYVGAEVAAPGQSGKQVTVVSLTVTAG